MNDARNIMLTGDAIGGLRLWDLRKKALPVVMAAFSPFSGQVDKLTFSPDGKWLAASAQEEAPRVFSLETSVLTNLVDFLTQREFTEDELIRYSIPKELNSFPNRGSR